jgi:hypothetical protein
MQTTVFTEPRAVLAELKRALTFFARVWYGSPSHFMQSRSMPNLMNPRRLRRGMAILLLTFAFFDLAVIDIIAPQLCNDGFSTKAGAASAQNASEKFDQNATVEAAIGARNSSPQQDSHSNSSPASTEEDCFCCCSHILPGFSFEYVTLNTMPRVAIALIASLPAPPPQDAFHPPRQA